MLNGSENSVRGTENNSFWSILREAVAGSERDFTQGSIGLAIFLLAVPMILEMLMESIFALVDIFFVAHLGAESVAVVGLTESMLAIVYAVAIGLSIGATATVARRTGEKDAEGAARTAAHAIYLGVIVSLVMSAIGIIFAPTFLSLLGAEPRVVVEGTTFTRIMLGGNAVIVFLFLLNAVFRGAGDAAIAMRVLILANLLNIILAPCFILGSDIFAFFGVNAPQAILDNWIFPKLGVTGAAVGTTIGRGVGVLFAAWYLFRKSGRITIHKQHWTFDSEIFSSLVKIAAPAVLQFTIATASWSALVRVIAGFGSEAIAGYVIGLRVIMFALLPAVGLSNAAATLVGQNLGAEKPERAEASVWKAAFINAAVLGAVSLLFLFFSEKIVGFFTDEAQVLAYGTDCLHIVAYGFVFYGFGMVLESSFNGAGDTWTPTYLNLFIFWLFEIPLAYTLAYRFDFGADGVFWAITIAFSLLAIVSAVLFKRGKWKSKIV
ncbi:MAG TPA: MATE family efflux transporter [Pyrinomonadaceae bacterium]|nr:MATE family efflux transporter [Pyrinomonadaceae bacterium]